MKGRELLNRIAALLLAFVMTVSMSGFVFECFAEDGAMDADAGNETEAVSDDAAGDPEAAVLQTEQPAVEEQPAEETGGAQADTGTEPQAEPEPQVDPEPEPQPQPEPEPQIDPQPQPQPQPEPQPQPQPQPQKTVFRTSALKSGSIAPGKVKRGSAVMELRSLTGEKHAGYAVVQGGCTDGVYAYYLMVSSKNQNGRVLKLRMKDNAVVKVSKVLNVYHGNGMAYDAKRNLLVVSSRDSRRQELTMINASTLQITRQAKVKYTYFKNAAAGLTASRQADGLAAITYNRYYDCYIGLERVTHDLILFHPDTLQAIAYIQTKISSKYPGVYQAMDADDQYVYLLLSSDGKTQKKNVILALDWNSENLKPIKDGTAFYITTPWKCGNDKSGAPDAAITLKTPYEAENIFHTADKNGKGHFYLSEYNQDPQYKWVRKKVKYKVKWKKVKKKVKWKRVKKKGKWKWKYKKKKVWKYKTKYKYVMVREVDYCNRYNYVYDLGTF